MLNEDKQEADLRRSKTREGKHADLAGDERPVLVRVDLLKIVPQDLPYGLQDSSHP